TRHVDVVRPLGGVKGQSPKTLKPRNVRHVDLIELTEGRDQDLSRKWSLAGGNPPFGAPLIPPSRCNVSLKMHVTEHAKLLGTMPQVVLDLLLAGIISAPFELVLEGKGI